MEMDAGWSEVFDSADRIAATGSQQMIESMLSALQSNAPKEAILAQLRAIEKEGPTIGQNTGTAVGQGIGETGAPAANQQVRQWQTSSVLHLLILWHYSKVLRHLNQK